MDFFNYLATFQNAQQEIYNNIDSIGKKINPAVGCFHDGVAYPELYLAAAKKIMWILKNSYDESDADGNPVSDGMDIRDWFCDQSLEAACHKQIFIKMSLITYCIQNNIPYSESLLSDKALIMQSLKSIALIDLSKLPGGTSISDKELKKEFSYFRDVFSEQITLYSPDIIIFGNTLHICYDVFSGLNYNRPIDVYTVSGNCLLRSFRDSDRDCLYLEAYHPSYPMSYEDYAGTIVNEVLR